MTATHRDIHTPDATKGRYVVARALASNLYSWFYLRDWDDEWGASFSGIGGAMTFDTKDDAIRAAMRAKRAVPTDLDGVPFIYDAVIAA